MSVFFRAWNVYGLPGVLTSVFTATLVLRRYIPPNDPALQYRGCARVNATAERARFDRLVEATSGFRYDSAGVPIYFRTDATRARVRCMLCAPR